MKRLCRGVLPLLALLLGAGCTNNPPVIRDIWWMPVTVEDRERKSVHRELMLYVQVEDGEGPADLAEIRLEKGNDTLVWKADPSLWKERREGDVLWVGSSRIASLGEALEEGDYLLTVEDRGGRTDRMPLTLTGWFEKEELSLHGIQKRGDEIILTSPAEGWFFLPSGEKGAPEEGKLRSLPLGTPFSPADYLPAAGGLYYLLLFDRNRMAVLKEGPYTYLSAE